MSDDLDRILHEKKKTRRSPINPNVAAMPRVHGGRPLGEGPKLDVPFPWDTEDDDAESTQLQTRTPEVVLPQDRPVLSGGPHFAMPPRKEEALLRKEEGVPRKDEEVQTPGAIVPIVKAEVVAEAPPPPPTPPPATPEKPEPLAKSPEKPQEKQPEKQREMQKEHLRAVRLYKSYRKGSVEVPVLRGVDVRIHQGEFLAIEGQSGSGKSTLLHLLGTLDSPNKGEVHFHGRRIDNLPAANRDAIRNKRIGMIFQFYHLLPELSTLENVLTPLMIAEGVWNYWRNRRKHQETAKSLLNLVGLSHRLKHKPRELSGGEMQRAAIARALIAQPELILADEPTGNLDQATGREILKILRTLNDRQKLTIVMVTHDQSLARQADRIVRLSGGVIEE